MRLDKELVEQEHEFRAFVVEVAAMNPSTLFAVSQLYSVCFCHLRSLVIVIPRSRCSSVVTSCLFAIVAHPNDTLQCETVTNLKSAMVPINSKVKQCITSKIWAKPQKQNIVENQILQNK